MSVWGNLLLSELAARDELVDQRRPLGSEFVCTRKGTITTADGKSIDSLQYHVLGGKSSAGSLVKLHAPGGSDEGTTLGQVTSHIVPVGLADIAGNESLVSLVDAKGIAAHVNGGTDNRADNGIHAWRVTSGGHDGDLLLGRHGGKWRHGELSFYAKVKISSRFGLSQKTMSKDKRGAASFKSWEGSEAPTCQAGGVVNKRSLWGDVEVSTPLQMKDDGSRAPPSGDVERLKDEEEWYQ